MEKHDIETRDFLQHRFVAEIYSGNASEHLLFKGGTMLRVCGIPKYRYSEDLDFDLFEMSIADCYTAIEYAVEQISEDTNIDIAVQRGNPIEPSAIIWSDEYFGEGEIVLDINPVASIDQIETSIQKIQSNHLNLNLSPDILCYSFPQVAASKFNCLSNRFRGRDIYDMWHLSQYHSVLKKGWDKYRHTWQTYPKTSPPELIVDKISQNITRFEVAWQEDTDDGFLPKSDFTEIMTSLMKKMYGLPGINR